MQVVIISLNVAYWEWNENRLSCQWRHVEILLVLIYYSIHLNEGERQLIGNFLQQQLCQEDFNILWSVNVTGKDSFTVCVIWPSVVSFTTVHVIYVQHHTSFYGRVLVSLSFLIGLCVFCAYNISLHFDPFPMKIYIFLHKYILCKMRARIDGHRLSSQIILKNIMSCCFFTYEYIDDISRPKMHNMMIKAANVFSPSVPAQGLLLLFVYPNAPC